MERRNQIPLLSIIQIVDKYLEWSSVCDSAESSDIGIFFRFQEKHDRKSVHAGHAIGAGGLHAETDVNKRPHAEAGVVVEQEDCLGDITTPSPGLSTGSWANACRYFVEKSASRGWTQVADSPYQTLREDFQNRSSEEVPLASFVVRKPAQENLGLQEECKIVLVY